MRNGISLFQRLVFICAAIAVIVTTEPIEAFAAVSQSVSTSKAKQHPARHKKTHHVRAKDNAPKICAEHVAFAEANGQSALEAELIIHMLLKEADRERVSPCAVPHTQFVAGQRTTAEIHNAAKDVFENGAAKLDRLPNKELKEATNFVAPTAEPLNERYFTLLGQVDPFNYPKGNIFWKRRVQVSSNLAP